jgi:ribosomal protein L17
MVGGAREAGVHFVELDIISNINYTLVDANTVTDFVDSLFSWAKRGSVSASR